jgi:hypothetical protein
MAIIPDSKNWTWVLERDCPECGFSAGSVDTLAMADAVKSVAGEWPALLAHPAVRRCPDDQTWSALEYGCHVRDMFDVFAGRLQRMLTEDGPRYSNWDQDATAVEEQYNLQDPHRVADELAVAAGRMAMVGRRA